MRLYCLATGDFQSGLTLQAYLLDKLGLGWPSDPPLLDPSFFGFGVGLFRAFLDGLAQSSNFLVVVGFPRDEVMLGGVDVGEVVFEGSLADAAVAVVLRGPWDKLNKIIYTNSAFYSEI